MALWHDSKSIDDIVRASDRTLNFLVVVLLAAFALGSAAYYYGQMNPRAAATSTSQEMTPARP
ncbi:MAG: hypothetical protein QM780_13205 [Hyphomicrobium sp.]|uniref:hypothetical protein n=1 Tax=Hyphomicrobium sp. TaxID=82 RepID=UPI0039E58C0C